MERELKYQYGNHIVCQAIQVLLKIWNWNIIIHSKVVLSIYRLVSSYQNLHRAWYKQWHNIWNTQTCFQSRQAWISNESELSLLHLLVTINFKAIYWVWSPVQIPEPVELGFNCFSNLGIFGVGFRDTHMNWSLFDWRNWIQKFSLLFDMII